MKVGNGVCVGGGAVLLGCGVAVGGGAAEVLVAVGKTKVRTVVGVGVIVALGTGVRVGGSVAVGPGMKMRSPGRTSPPAGMQLALRRVSTATPNARLRLARLSPALTV